MRTWPIFPNPVTYYNMETTLYITATTHNCTILTFNMMFQSNTFSTIGRFLRGRGDNAPPKMTFAPPS